MREKEEKDVHSAQNGRKGDVRWVEISELNARNGKTGFKAIIIIAIIATSSMFACLLLHDIYSTEGENYTTVNTSSTPIIKSMFNASPLMAFASNTEPRNPLTGSIWHTLPSRMVDTFFSSTASSFWELPWRTWRGRSLKDDDVTPEDSWTTIFDLGRPTYVDKIRFQLGDLFTTTKYYDPVHWEKHYTYTLYVRPASYNPGEWLAIAMNQNNVPDEESWKNNLLNGTYVTDKPSMKPQEPLGSLLDPFSDNANWKTGNNVLYYYLVADGGSNSVKRYIGGGPWGGGSWVNEIYKSNSLGGTNLWIGEGTKPTDVAAVPDPDGNPNFSFDGGYYITTDDGRMWFYEYKEGYINPSRAVTDTGDFSKLTQVTTYWDGISSKYHVYILEDDAGTFSLYHYERSVSQTSIRYQPNSGGGDANYEQKYDFHWSSDIGNITCYQDKVFVQDKTGNRILVFNEDLSPLGIITKGGWKPGDITMIDNRLLVLDLSSNKLFSFDSNGTAPWSGLNNKVGEVYMRWNTANSGTPKLIASKPIGTDPIQIWIASSDHPSGTESLSMVRKSSTFLGLPRYTDWEQYVIDGVIVEYRIDFFNVRLGKHPFYGWEPPKTDSIGPVYSGWNKPQVAETVYDWKYDSTVDGLDVEITSPREGDNFVAYGEVANFPLTLDVDVRKISHFDLPFPSYKFNLKTDSVKFSLDGGDNITLLNNEAIDIDVTPTDWTLHNYTISGGYIFNDSIEYSNINRTFYEKTIDFGSQGAIYQVSYINKLDSGESNPGNAFEVLLDGVPVAFVEDLYQGTTDNTIRVGDIAIGNGIHTIKMQWQGGSGKVRHGSWTFHVHDSLYSFKKTTSSSSLPWSVFTWAKYVTTTTPYTVSRDFPTSTVYRLKLYYSGGAGDGDVWNIKIDGDLVKRVDENMFQQTDDVFDATWVAAIYVPQGYHQITFELVSGPGTLDSLAWVHDIYSIEGISALEGAHTIQVWANDTNGHEDTDSVDFTVIEYPRIRVYSPLDESGINSNFSLRLTVSDSNLDTVYYRLNDGPKIIISTPVNGNIIFYEELITLSRLNQNEFNQIEVVANDTVNHQSFVFRTFFVDFKKPIITFPGMDNNTFIREDGLYNINVTDETLQQAWYTLNGIVKFDLVAGLQTVSIPLLEFSEGLNNLTVFALDSVGNNATAYLNLTKDTAGPFINFSAPQYFEKFFVISGVEDVIPFNVTAQDFVVNRSSTSFVDFSQTQFDDFIRLHITTFTEFHQGFTTGQAQAITEVNIRARGTGRIKLILREDPFLIADPISVGYVDITSDFDFQWYTCSMSDARIDSDREYFLYVETVTPFNDLYVQVANNPYPDGKIIMGGIPRPQWDLTFETLSKQLIEEETVVEMWYNIDGGINSAVTTDGNITIANLSDVFSFTQGYHSINVFAKDDNENEARSTLTIQYIDTSVVTNIDVTLTSQQENEWVFENITVTWDHNIPDYSDRVTKELYTHDIYLQNQTGDNFFMITLLDANRTSINTTLVPDGYYYVTINSTDGSPIFDNDKSELIRILNGIPICVITSPEDGSYVSDITPFEVTVISADLIDVMYSLNQFINISIKTSTFDFYEGYTFTFNLETDVEDGFHFVEVFAVKSDGKTSYDAISIIRDSVTTISVVTISQTLAAGGSIVIQYNPPYDAENLTITLQNTTHIIFVLQLSGDEVTGSILLQDGLPPGDYKVTMTVTDRAGNSATDAMSFSVQQSAYADFIDSIFEFFSGIFGFILGGLGITTVFQVKKYKRIDKCTISGTCSI